jgi:hypothetical protein
VSGIVLSASVRQNLLSLQSTASLLATTQNDLATGNAVNSALDNPTNFFTAAGLNNRASDIGNLLDSIGNGVQVLFRPPTPASPARPPTTCSAPPRRHPVRLPPPTLTRR